MHTAGELPFHDLMKHAFVNLPRGSVGPMVLPGSHRKVWWTGRVAIGLRYEPSARSATANESTSMLVEARRS